METIKIVSFDWLEDSLRTKRCLKEQKYLMEALHVKKLRQTKGGVSCNFKVTKSGRPSKGELVSLFASHLDEHQSSCSAGRGGLKETKARTRARANASAAAKGKGKVMGKGKKNQERPVMTATCPNTAVDLLEAHLRARKEKASAPTPNDESQPFISPTLPTEHAGDEASTSPLNIPDINVEPFDDLPIVMDPPNPIPSEHQSPFHSSSSSDPTNQAAPKPHCSSVPANTNTLPLPRKPPQKKPSPDDWIPMDPSKYHIYKDCNGFEYSATLARIDIRRNSNEQFVLRLYEGHTSDFLVSAGDEDGIVVGAKAGGEAEGGGAHVPRMYAVWLRFVGQKNGGEPVVQRLAAEGSAFESAMGVFKRAFRTWTGRRWEERDKNVKDAGGEGEGSGSDGQVEEDVVAWETGVGMAAGLPSRKEVKSRPFVYLKPRAGARPKSVFGLSGKLIMAKYPAWV